MTKFISGCQASRQPRQLGPFGRTWRLGPRVPARVLLKAPRAPLPGAGVETLHRVCRPWHNGADLLSLGSPFRPNAGLECHCGKEILPEGSAAREPRPACAPLLSPHGLLVLLPVQCWGDWSQASQETRGTREGSGRRCLRTAPTSRTTGGLTSTHLPCDEPLGRAGLHHLSWG